MARSDLTRRAFVAAGIASVAGLGRAEMGGNLVTDPRCDWRFLSDRVMGGVSDGQAQRQGEVLSLRGTVSTENNGGFIQARCMLAERPAPDTAAIGVEARGNGEDYFIHLRTQSLMLPWQYYQARFPTSAEWQATRIPLAAFVPSGSGMRRDVRPTAIESLGLVAFGRPHVAELDIRRVAFVP